jgi:hypothetical protein
MKHLIAVAVLLLANGGAFAGSPKGIEVVNFTLTHSFYLPCLGEQIDTETSIEARQHLVETPSGTIHIIDNWQMIQYAVSSTSGQVWVGRGVSPFQMNIRAGEVQQWTSTGRYVPVDGHAPAFIYTNTFKVTINANGQLVVDRPDVPESEGFKCVGPNK